MKNAGDDRKQELQRTERLGWVSVGCVVCALIPAAMVVAGITHPGLTGALAALLCAGLAGLMVWYLRVRRSVRRLNEMISRLYAHAREQDTALHKLEELKNIQKTSMRMISHQLRAPLAAMQSCLSVLLAAEDMEEEDAHRLLHDAQARGEDMMALVNDILSLAESESMVRIETEVDSEDIDVEPAVREIVNFFAPRAAEKGVTFRVDVLSPPGVISANRKLFNHVVLNLVSNAFRYSDDNREVVLTLEALNRDRLRFTVTNHGLVIPPEQREDIFREFWRSDEARKRVGRGTGLGLSIVKNIVEFRGGAITVDSDAENGTRFTVDIPRQRKGGDLNG